MHRLRGRRLSFLTEARILQQLWISNSSVRSFWHVMLLIVLAAVDLGKLGLSANILSSENVSLYRIVVIVALVGWTTVARLVRASTLSLKTRPFVMAARAQGAGAARIMLRHILPNLASPIIVATTLSVGNVILLESVLSFLGLGIQPPLPSWGQMINIGISFMFFYWHMALFPTLALAITVLVTTLFGDGLRDALDPTLKGKN